MVLILHQRPTTEIEKLQLAERNFINQCMLNKGNYNPVYRLELQSFFGNNPNYNKSLEQIRESLLISLYFGYYKYGESPKRYGDPPFTGLCWVGSPNVNLWAGSTGLGSTACINRAQWRSIIMGRFQSKSCATFYIDLEKPQLCLGNWNSSASKLI